ncbi:hypothetical protein ACJIZ3_021209 [Penstemon smallii]|uniref:RING-type E3 ubiquitin transferase n=1 Tax=Penstemon smallii TaxID=265156 RepID=A0ABD3SL34_9LAMI
MITTLFLLHLIFFFINIKAQNLAESTGVPSQDTVSNFQPSLAVVIGMLSIMFSLTFILLLYAKFCHRPSSEQNTSNQIQDGLLRSRLDQPMGVEKEVIESLPYFRFSSLKGSREGLECSVCIAKFEDIEILRLLPKCKHAFHIDCIDQWLEKHSTCPLCRQKVSADDLSQLPYSNSLRFLWNQMESREESNLELYVQREESRHGSSRFSIGNSFRKLSEKGKNEEELPIQQSKDCDEQPLHKLNHKIYVSDVVLKHRWSNVSSSDLMFLNSEMLNDLSSARFSSLDLRNEQKSMVDCDQEMSLKEEMDRKRLYESKFKEIEQSGEDSRQNRGLESKAVNQNDKRSMSEIVVHPRFTELRNRDENNVKEERMRKLWIPIARKTVQWFANREIRPPQNQLHENNV